MEIMLFGHPACDRCSVNDAIATLDQQPVCRACLLPAEYDAVNQVMRDEMECALDEYETKFGDYSPSFAQQQQEMLDRLQFSLNVSMLRAQREREKGASGVA
jgi:hypothetical protein